MLQNPDFFEYDNEKYLDNFYSNLTQKSEIKSIKIWEMLYTIIIELIGDPVQCNEFVQLWNFILLSHPAHDNYLEYLLINYTTWISLGLIFFYNFCIFRKIKLFG